MKLNTLFLALVPFLAINNLAMVKPNSTHNETGVDTYDRYGNIADYESWISSWSKKDHLYIHYNRGSDASDTDYSKYALWIWQHKPQDIGGSLWAYGGKTDVSSTLTLQPMSTGFMTGSQVKESGSSMWIDQYGAIIDVDMSADILPGKKGGGNATLLGATEVGFLIVLESSMGGGSHWTSDGGKNTYLENFNLAVRPDGSTHVYINTGDFDNYAYNSADVKPMEVNPVTDDTTGNYRSKTQTISDTYGVSSTADAFKSLGVGYQVFVSSFRDSNGDGLGDIRGIINSLDYLEDLGVQVLWLTPIQKSDSYHGYDIIDYYAVDDKFGTIDDYRELIYKAHKKGMKVLMDLVLNHTSKSNVWFKNSQWAKEGIDQNGNKIEWRNVYHWKYKDDSVLKYNKTSGDWSTSISVENDAKSDNPSWYRDGLSNYYYYGKFGSGMPEINYEYQPTRDLVKDMAKYWLSFGLDGFRLDAVKHIYMKDEVANTGSDRIIKDVGQRTYYDTEQGKSVTVDFDYSSDLNKNVAWWKEFANDLKKVYPNCFLVGENFDGYGNRTAAYYQALDSQFAFNHYYHIESKLFTYGPGAYASAEPKEGEEAFRGSSAEYWVDGVKQADLPGGNRGDFIDGSFTSNHDVMRAINHAAYTEYEYSAEHNPVGTVDNPKVTGTAKQIERAKVHAAMTMLTPGISWIYYGDELGMSSNTDKHVTMYGNENSKDIWYRQPFKWGGEAAKDIVNYSAGGYKIEWDDYNKTIKNTAEQAADNTSMLRYYQDLGKIKNMYPKNAKVAYSNDGNLMWLDITGTGRTIKICIVPGEWDSGYYAPSFNFTNQLNGFTKIDTPALNNYTSGNITSSIAGATVIAWYK